MRWSGRIFWLLACGSAFAERPFFPPSPFFCGGSRPRLHNHSVAGETPATTTIGLGKSYPVTAAQLLPVSTGFLAPIHFPFSSSQRTKIDNYPFALLGSRQI